MQILPSTFGRAIHLRQHCQHQPSIYRVTLWVAALVSLFAVSSRLPAQAVTPIPPNQDINSIIQKLADDDFEIRQQAMDLRTCAKKSNTNGKFRVTATTANVFRKPFS